MKKNKLWYDQDTLWESLEPILFSQQRQSDAASEVDKMINLLRIKENARILDLCCGIGRHTLEFCRRGFAITGVDRTRLYLKKAQKQAKLEGLNAEFVEADMRSFRRANSFDIAMNLFSSFGYFEDPQEDRLVAKNVYDSLKPRGKFILDMMGKEVLARIFRERDWREESGYLVLEERTLSKNWGWIKSSWTVISDTNRFQHQISLRLYSAVELSSLLTECGFSEIQVYGDFEGNDYDQSARRLVVVANKP